jgi:hypothetical protein
MSAGRILIIALLSGTAGCADDPAPPMWSGADISQPLVGLGPPRPYSPPLLSPSTLDRAPERAPQRRVGSGVVPDVQRGLGQTNHPPTQMPLTSAPSLPASPPSPLDGPGYQRTGPITYGPGGPYNSVGTTIFGPGGRVCTPVGSSLTCL